MTKSKKNNSSFEDAFKKLETIVETLEKGESSLDDSTKIFEDGMELVKFCTEKLNQTEARLQKLVKQEDGGFQLELVE